MATVINKQTGADTIQYTPVAAASAGDIVAVGNLIGYYAADVAAGKVGTVIIDGVCQVTKPNDEAWTLGLKVYYDSSEEEFTTTATGNTFAGLSLVAAETATTAQIALKGAMLSDSTAQEAANVVDLTDNSGGVDPEDDTVAAVTVAAQITDSSGGVDSGDDTIAAVTNTTDLTDNGGGSADGTVASQAAPTTLTDSTGYSGTHDDTLAATTVPTKLTGTLTGTVDGAVEDIAATAGSCAGDASPSAANVDTAIATAVASIVTGTNLQLKELQTSLAAAIDLQAVQAQNASNMGQKIIELVALAATAQDNLKEVTTELATQRTANIAILAAIAQLAAKANVSSTADTAIMAGLSQTIAKQSEIITSLEGADLMATA